ncbi:MAG: DNA polymerase I [Rickettsiales bacterium]|jgi:DNA polymerase-1|nr:DNA polymerase I [Rickettsiales bacterium]
MNKKYILVDGSGYIFRAFYALPAISRSDGLPVGAVYGFCNMLLKLLGERDGKGEIITVVFDAARKNFRNDIYKEYKANRLETPPELAPQFAYIRKAVEAFGLPSVEQIGYEADDLIATYAAEAADGGDETLIYSSDKDLMQLLATHVYLYDPLKQRQVTKETVFDKFGVAPDRVVDVQALVGDASDNIPGVRGIGPKIAAELILKYGSLEGLLKNARNITQDKRREMIESGADMARISYRLATLKRDVPLATPLSALARTPVDAARLAKFFDEMEFKSLLPKARELADNSSRLAARAAEPIVMETFATTATRLVKKEVEKRYELVRSADKLREWAARCGRAGRFAVDTETTGLDSLSAGLVGVSLAVDEGVACYIPLAHKRKVFGGANLFDGNEEHPVEGQIPLDEALGILGPLLENPKVAKIGHNMKYDMHVFRQHGISVAPVEDTMVMSYVLDSVKNLHNMDDLALLHLGYRTISFEDVCGSGKSRICFDEVPLDKALGYAAEDADITLRLYNVFAARLASEDARKVYADIDRPLVPVLCDMEELGVRIDEKSLVAISVEFEKELDALGREIYADAGGEFNILSPKQLGEVLFDKMGLPAPKRSAKGDWSTDVEVLRSLSYGGATIADKILKYREIAKLKGTYADALPKQISPRDGRVHTHYFQAGTSTGRLSSNDPNLQNIPIRTGRGQDIRRAFVASNGYVLLSADYSQIELRILADMADVKNLKHAFEEGIDIHAKTASEIFGVPMDKMTPELRRRAKAINFGIIYGISPFGLAKNVGATQAEARTFIDSYFRAFPEIRAYMDDTKAFAHSHGYVETKLGRRCFIANINNPKLKSYGERAAINAPIQGTNADIIKIAMARIRDRLRKEKLDSEIRMLLQVHDELVFEVREDLVGTASGIVKPIMEGAAKLSIPATVGIGTGDNWKDAH